MRLVSRGLTLLVGATIGLGVASISTAPLALADEPEFEQRVAEIRQLLERAEIAAAEGRDEDARDLADQVRNLIDESAETELTVDEEMFGEEEAIAEEPPQPARRIAFRPPLDETAEGPPEGGHPEADRRAMFREQGEKMRELHRRIQELEEAGQSEEAAALRQQLREMRRRLAEEGPGPRHRGPHRDGARGGPEGEAEQGPGRPRPEHFHRLPEEMRERLQTRFREIREEMIEAYEADDMEKVASLREEAGQLMRRAWHAAQGGSPSDRPDGPPPGGGPRHGFGPPQGDGPPPGDRPHGEGPPREARRPMGPIDLRPVQAPQARRRNIRLAAALLESAGFADEAKRVRDLSEQIPQDTPPVDARPGRPERSGPPDEGPRRGGPDELRKRIERLEQEIGRLREHIESSQDD